MNTLNQPRNCAGGLAAQRNILGQNRLVFKHIGTGKLGIDKLMDICLNSRFEISSKGLGVHKAVPKNKMDTRGNIDACGLRFAWKANPPAVCGRKWFRNGLICLGLAGIGMVSFLSLRSTPAISTLWWVPKPIAHWADRHGQFCNFPAYGAMGVPFFLVNSGFRRQLGIAALLSAFIISLELTQLAIPTRHCDIWDMFWGSLGVVTALAVCETIKRFRITLGSQRESAQ